MYLIFLEELLGKKFLEIGEFFKNGLKCLGERERERLLVLNLIMFRDY